MKFSERLGLTPIRTALQIESMDDALRNRLWNILVNYFESIMKKGPKHSEFLWTQIWKEHYGFRIDEIPKIYGRINEYSVIREVKEKFLKRPWHYPYDLLEFLVEIDRYPAFRDGLAEECNRALEKESSGYRIIDLNVVQITSEIDIQEIEKALVVGAKYDSIKDHLKTALAFLSHREKPDFDNSIKESISAVESLCIIETGEKDSFAKALGIIEKRWKIHGALKTAFSSIYGYTSDAGGIRHANIGGPDATREEAMFMLVACSAFSNYLISNVGKVK